MMQTEWSRSAGARHRCEWDWIDSLVSPTLTPTMTLALCFQAAVPTVTGLHCSSCCWSKQVAGVEQGLTCRTMSMVTSPADGMAAAPMAANVAVQATTTVPASPNSTPCACPEWNPGTHMA